jgi:hypothetical protein
MRATCPPFRYPERSRCGFPHSGTAPTPDASGASELQPEGKGSALERGTRTLGRGDSRRTGL